MKNVCIYQRVVLQREYNPINDPVSNSLLNSLINEGTSKVLQPVQRRIQGTHEYRHIRNSEMKWINNQLHFIRYS